MGLRDLAVRAAPERAGRRVMPADRYMAAAVREGGRMTFGSVLFEGSLRVIDPDRFRRDAVKRHRLWQGVRFRTRSRSPRHAQWRDEMATLKDLRILPKIEIA